MTEIAFEATLHHPRDESGWTFVRLPKDASDQLPSRGMVSVAGRLNDVEFAATLSPDGEGGHWLKVKPALEKSARAQVGEAVRLQIAPVAEEPEPEVPPDLAEALESASAKARETWEKTTPVARRDWIQWISTPKKAETRRKRIESGCDMLDKGKKRPCCFDRSGMYDKSVSCPIADDEA